uniref:C-C motif chemokine n=1 Tax=Sus scrofa TaxID=9823 RepID=A0A8D1QU16_PIG
MSPITQLPSHSVLFFSKWPWAFLSQNFLFFWGGGVLFRATPSAYGSSQARGRVRAAAAGLYHSHTILPIASSCCTEVSHHISRRLLERVNTCRLQRADGDCDLAAVILHVKRRRICVSPHNHLIKQWMKEQAAKKDAKGNICHKKKHHSKRNSKGAHQEKHETHGHKTPY